MKEQDLPRISIVTPSFGNRDTIEDTILSIAQQEYPNLEYIVVDGAGDDTRQVLERHNDKIDWWCSEPDDGQYDAIRKGFARSTGEILFWLNADDMLLPRSLWAVADVFSHFAQIEWLSTLRPGRFDAFGYLVATGMIPGFSKAAFLDGYFLPSTLKSGSWIQQESTFFRRSLWEKCGHALTSAPLAGDFALWCEFYKRVELVGLTYPIGGFRGRTGQRSENKRVYIEEATQALERLREHEEWKPDRMTPVLRYNLARKLPRVRDRMANALGYHGRRVVRVRPKDKDATWAVEDHRWLPL